MTDLENFQNNDVYLEYQCSQEKTIRKFEPLLGVSQLDFLDKSYFYIFVSIYMCGYVFIFSEVKPNYQISLILASMSFILCILLTVVLLNNSDKLLLLSLLRKFEWWYLVVSVAIFQIGQVIILDYDRKIACYDYKEWKDLSLDICYKYIILESILIRTIAIIITVLMISTDILPYMKSKYKKVCVFGLIFIYMFPLIQNDVSEFKMPKFDLCIFYCTDFGKTLLGLCLNVCVFFTKLLFNMYMNTNSFSLLNSAINYRILDNNGVNLPETHNVSTSSNNNSNVSLNNTTNGNMTELPDMGIIQINGIVQGRSRALSTPETLLKSQRVDMFTTGAPFIGQFIK